MFLSHFSVIQVIEVTSDGVVGISREGQTKDEVVGSEGLVDDVVCSRKELPKLSLGLDLKETDQVQDRA